MSHWLKELVKDKDPLLLPIYLLTSCSKCKSTFSPRCRAAAGKTNSSISLNSVKCHSRTAACVNHDNPTLSGWFNGIKTKKKAWSVMWISYKPEFLFQAGNAAASEADGWSNIFSREVIPVLMVSPWLMSCLLHSWIHEDMRRACFLETASWI